MKKVLVNGLRWILLTVTFAHVSVAAGASATGPDAATNQFGTQISAALGALQTTGKSMSGALVPTGENLLYVFYAITLAWYVYEALASQQLDMLFKKLISHTMIALIALEMLWGWTDSSGIGITNFLTVGMNSLENAFVQGGNPADNIIDAYYPAIESTVGIITTGVAHIQTAVTAASDIFSGMLVFYGSIGIFIVTGVMALLSAGLLAIAMVYALFFANLGDFIIWVGLAVGPIFIATLVFPAAQGFFSKWLEFVISGGMYKLVAVVVGKLLAGILTLIGTSTAIMISTNATLWTGGGSLVELIGVTLILIVWSLFAYFLTKQIPHFVTALSGGVNIHLSSLNSLAPHPPSMPKFASAKKSPSSENSSVTKAEIKAATAIRTAEIKAASTVKAAEIKVAGDLDKIKMRQSVPKGRSKKAAASESPPSLLALPPPKRDSE